MSDLLFSQHLSDLQIETCDGDILYAHWAILTQVSPFFDTLSRLEVVPPHHIKTHFDTFTMRVVIESIYKNVRILIPIDNVQHIIEAFGYFQIDDTRLYDLNIDSITADQVNNLVRLFERYPNITSVRWFVRICGKDSFLFKLLSTLDGEFWKLEWINDSGIEYGVSHLLHVHLSDVASSFLLPFLLQSMIDGTYETLITNTLTALCNVNKRTGKYLYILNKTSDIGVFFPPVLARPIFEKFLPDLLKISDDDIDLFDYPTNVFVIFKLYKLFTKSSSKQVICDLLGESVLDSCERMKRIVSGENYYLDSDEISCSPDQVTTIIRYGKKTKYDQKPKGTIAFNNDTIMIQTKHFVYLQRTVAGWEIGMITDLPKDTIDQRFPDIKMLRLWAIHPILK